MPSGRKVAQEVKKGVTTVAHFTGLKTQQLRKGPNNAKITVLKLTSLIRTWQK